ncbi:hypothetical protein EFK50_14140 [Nocardioides marmoriginsengisoli]|uniref:Uncharacterized protein n=1 Tax=Nocardioides marmoriginsengisoli TaxID=661483 RepID=A0A3N0CHT1_9ACTN|nr:hypothetical protein [Nocardioides marmoriginsengisoli]RNL62869.1 hypothetical protein EFK50_14140 [Nocardioides marmoriginsengisoli]
MTTLLRKLSTTRTATTPVEVRYNPDEKIAYVHENGVWVPSYESSAVGQSKKADLETGEDQKGQ